MEASLRAALAETQRQQDASLEQCQPCPPAATAPSAFATATATAKKLAAEVQEEEDLDALMARMEAESAKDRSSALEKERKVAGESSNGRVTTLSSDGDRCCQQRRWRRGLTSTPTRRRTAASTRATCGART